MDSFQTGRFLEKGGVSPMGSTRSDRGITPEKSDDWRPLNLKPGEEAIFHTGSANLHARLADGNAEVLGSEMAPARMYSFGPGTHASFFTWEGCQLLVKDEGVNLDVEKGSLYPVYINIHIALENMRDEAEDELEVWKMENSTRPFLEQYGPDVFGMQSSVPTQSVDKPGGVAKRRRLEAASKKKPEDKVDSMDFNHPPPHGPRVMVLGDKDSGKSTLCKILCNYAARASRLPLFIDTCTNEGSVSVPSTLSATAIPRPIPPDAPQMYTSRHTYPLIPLIYFFGYQSPDMHPGLYKLLMEQLVNACKRKEWTDAEGVSISGWIVDTPHEMSRLTDGELHPLLQHAVDRMEPDVLLVIDNPPLLEVLKTQFPAMKVVGVPRANGAVERSVQDRRDLQEAQIRAYFYGPVVPPLPGKKAAVDLKAYSNEVKVSHVRVVRVGGEEGSENELPTEIETKIGKVELPPLIHIQTNPILERFVLAVSSCPTLPPLSETATDQEKKEREEMLVQKIVQPVRGFVHVSKIVEKRNVVTWLAPAPKLPHTYLIMGSLKANIV